MADSPMQRFLDAVDTLDVERVIAMTANDCALLLVDGRRARGTEAMRATLGELLSSLRSATHTITSQWQLDDLSIAEVDATYELRDGQQTAVLPRAFFLREGPDGISELRVYGAHERPLDEQERAQGGMRVGGRWLPPL